MAREGARSGGAAAGRKGSGQVGGPLASTVLSPSMAGRRKLAASVIRSRWTSYYAVKLTVARSLRRRGAAQSSPPAPACPPVRLLLGRMSARAPPLLSNRLQPPSYVLTVLGKSNSASLSRTRADRGPAHSIAAVCSGYATFISPRPMGSNGPSNRDLPAARAA